MGRPRPGFEVTGDEVALQDEAQFHDHARTMGYPDQVVRGAWSGISTIAARYTNSDWPFDGSMESWLSGHGGPALGLPDQDTVTGGRAFQMDELGLTDSAAGDVRTATRPPLAAGSCTRRGVLNKAGGR